MSHTSVPIGRREVIAGAATLALAATSSPRAHAQSATAETARGTVYDADSDPRRGVPGVMVSNGLDVVKTDPRGTLVAAGAGTAIRYSSSSRPDGRCRTIRPLACRASRICTRRTASPDLGVSFRGVGTDRSAAGQHRFRAAPAAGTGALRRDPLHRSTAGKPAGGRTISVTMWSPRWTHAGGCIRHHPRRHHVR